MAADLQTVWALMRWWPTQGAPCQEAQGLPCFSYERVRNLDVTSAGREDRSGVQNCLEIHPKCPKRRLMYPLNFHKL